MRPSLGRVLAFSFGAVAVGAVVVTAVVTVYLSRVGAPQRAMSELRAEAQGAADIAAGLPCDAGPRPGAALARELGPRVRFIPDDAPPRPRDAAFSGSEGRATLGGHDVLYASTRATVCGRNGTLYAVRAANEVPALPPGFGGRLILAAIAALAVSLAVALALARRLSRPLHDLAASARSFSGGGAAPRPDGSDPREVADLKDAFSDMVSDLRSSQEREQNFLLSVSHELRTPLTAIRGYGEALADGTAKRPKDAGEVVLRESQRLERLVQDLLDLARLSSDGFSVHEISMDLADVAGDVHRAFQPLAEENGLELVLSVDGSSTVKSDPDRVHQMLANLVENALRSSPSGGAVQIDVRPGAIAVHDSGPGLERSDIEHAFERFYLWRKYQGSRPVGSGLGLAIVGELARRLGVEVVVGSDGDGSTFEIRFGS
jgi:two-component system, OmpR family, sensor kinase